MFYKMRTQSSCGPDELGAILAPFGVSQENVDKAFGIKNIGKFADLMVREIDGLDFRLKGKI